MSECTKSNYPAQDRKKSFDLLHVKSSFPLGFAERLVFSYLQNRKATIVQVASATGLGRNLVPRVLVKLKEVGLTMKEGNRWTGVKTHAEWFVGTSSIRYYQLAEGSPLTPKQNAVYCQIVSLQDRGVKVTVAAVARLLRIDRQTVYNALPILEKLGLVSVSVKANQPSNPEKFWQMAEDKPEQAPEKHKEQEDRVQDAEEDTDQEGLKRWIMGFEDIELVGSMLKAGLTEGEVEDVVKEANRAGIHLADLWEYTQGNTKYGNGYKLLKSLLNKRLRGEETGKTRL